MRVALNNDRSAFKVVERSLGHLRARARLVLGLLGDPLVVRNEGVHEAVVGVQRLPRHFPEDLPLLPDQPREALHRAAVELRVVLEGLEPVLEEPAGEPHAALLEVEGPIHRRAVRFAAEPVQLLRGFSSSIPVFLVHRAPSCTGSLMITAMALSGGRRGFLLWPTDYIMSSLAIGLALGL